MREGEPNQHGIVITVCTWLLMQGTFIVTVSGSMEGGLHYPREDSSSVLRPHLEGSIISGEPQAETPEMFSDEITSSGTNVGSGRKLPF